MKNTFLVLSLALAFVLPGCAGRQEALSSPGEQREAIQQKTLPSPGGQYEKTAALIVKSIDPLTHQTEYTGPPFPDVFSATNVFLRAIMPPDIEKILYQLYIVAYYKCDSRRMYDTAVDEEGKRLEMDVLSRSDGTRNGHGCAGFHEEHLIITFSDLYMESHSTTGLGIKISGPGGEEKIILPHYYTKAFWDLVAPQR